MPQFSLHRNPNAKTNAAIPFLLDVQNDLLSELGTRVVVPVFRRKNLKIQPLTKLTPEVEIQEEQHILMMPQLAGIPVRELGPVAGSLSNYRNEIISAIDLLVTGF